MKRIKARVKDNQQQKKPMFTMPGKFEECGCIEDAVTIEVCDVVYTLLDTFGISESEAYEELKNDISDIECTLAALVEKLIRIKYDTSDMEGEMEK